MVKFPTGLFDKSEMSGLDSKKYQNVILYLASELGGEIKGKKKLAKLLYFVDFDFFEKEEKSLTGETYKALPMGPFPTHMESIISNLEKNKQLTISSVEEISGYLPTEIYRSSEKPDISVFDEEELKIINRVVLNYGHLNGKQLEDLTHAEAPYIGTEPNHEIAYELSFYRGTEFSDA